MSVKLMSDVFERSKTEGNARLVLLCLADCANDDGACWPSIRKIAEKANLSEPIAKKYLNALIEIGVVNRDEREDQSGRQTSNYYTILVDQIGNDEITRDVLEQVTPKSRLAVREGVTRVSGGGGNAGYRGEGVTGVSLSIMNHQKEPSKEPSCDFAIASSFGDELPLNGAGNSATADTGKADALFSLPPQQRKKELRRAPRKSPPIDDAFIEELQRLNPAKNVAAEVPRAKSWILARPPRKFTRSFFTAWINRTKETIKSDDKWLPNTI